MFSVFPVLGGSSPSPGVLTPVFTLYVAFILSTTSALFTASINCCAAAFIVEVSGFLVVSHAQYVRSSVWSA